MKAEHEQEEWRKKYLKDPPSSDGSHEASDSVINGLMTVCYHLHTGWIDEIKAKAADLEKQLYRMPKDAPRAQIGFINYCALLYVQKPKEWSNYLRGEEVTRPKDIKYGKSYYLNVGEWMKCTILRRLLNPLKEIVKNLPKLNAPTETYPLKELREMFMHIDAIIGMMNACEEEGNSPEGSYLGHAVIAVHRLQQLVCPDEVRPGHVILECQSIAKAYAEFYKRMCNAAWALGFKVDNRDKNEINLDDELRKVIPQEEKKPVRNAVISPITDELEKKQYTEIMQKLDTIEGYVRPKGIDTQGVVALIRDDRTANIDGVTSLDKAVDYIRHCKPEDERFYARSVAARQFDESIAKAEAGGIDKRWGTLAQYAKTSDPEQRRKARGKGKPHANAIPQGW